LRNVGAEAIPDFVQCCFAALILGRIM